MGLRHLGQGWGCIAIRLALNKTVDHGTVQALRYWRAHNTPGHRMDAATGPVMTTVCSGTNLRPCSVLLSSSTLHKKLRSRAAEAPFIPCRVRPPGVSVSVLA